MKSKHKFVPSQVVPMEERALLSTFPAGIGPVTTLGLHGDRVLTATTYAAVQHFVTIDIQAFESRVINAFNTTTTKAAFDAAVGILSQTRANDLTVWAYAPGTPLATLDAQMGALEFKLPWGGGLGVNPTGGSGLSNKTAFTTSNPQSVGLKAFFFAKPVATIPAVPLGKGVSVAEDMDLTLGAEVLPTTSQVLLNDMNAVLTQAVSTSPTDSSVFLPGPVASGNMTAANGTLGILPGYIQAFGPDGARLFGLKNK